jgi:uncharacterized membrane protein YphA (DoxX/SURF4 family)
MYKLKKIALYFLQQYSLDIRALALMRMAIALVIITDLIIRCGDLNAHYTDEGLWPINLAKNMYTKPGSWSIHWLSGSTVWIIALFCSHFLAAICLLIGYKTRLANLVLWVLTISLHNRNLYILQAGDDLLRLVLFWGLFLPWNHYFCLDKTKIADKKLNFIGTLGYLFLISSVYFFATNLKTSNEWHSDGSAIYYALSLDQLRLPIGDWLYHYPKLMQVLTWLIYYMELFIPILILWPSKKGYLRWIAFLCILMLHVGIGLTLYVGLFFSIAIASSFGLLPDFVLNKFFTKIKKYKNHIATHLKIKIWLNLGQRYLASIVIVICLIVNLSSLSWFAFELKKEIGLVVNVFRFDQYWGMFAPTVFKNDGWYVHCGIDSSGKEHDLKQDKDSVDFTKPEHLVRNYTSDRWRKLAENMSMDAYTFLRPQCGNYYLREWNKQHPTKKMVTLNLYFMEELSLPNYATEPVTKNLFCVCNAH